MLADLVKRVRSKNAGPFWVTVDIFCGSEEVFARLTADLTTEAVAAQLGQDPEQLRRFDIEAIRVIKFSFPRPVPQGDAKDRDMHGAQWGVLLGELSLELRR